MREASRALGLEGWNRPALACLATRFPTGRAITAADLARVDAAEEALRTLGFDQVRVRCHGDLARIELAEGESWGGCWSPPPGPPSLPTCKARASGT